MKKIISFSFIFTVSLLTTFVKAQSWGQTGAEWYYSVPSMGFDPLYDFERFWIDKDTVVDNKDCFLVKSSKDSTLIFLSENEKVYLYLLDTFNLIYDYSAKLNDTVTFNIPARTQSSFLIDTIVNIPSILTYEGYVKFDNDSLKFYDYKYTVPPELQNYLILSGSYLYLERAGYTKEFFLNFNFPSIDPVTDLRCYNDIDHSYTADWFANENLPCDYKFQSSIRKTHQFGTNNNNFILSPRISKNDFSLDILDKSQSYLVVVFDISGKKILLNKNTCERLQFGANFTPGIYFISCFNMVNNQLEFSSKIIKL